MAPKTTKVANEEKKTDKKVDKKQVADDDAQAEQAETQFSVDELRIWFNFVVEMDFSKMIKDTSTKNEYETEFKRLNKIFIDSTNLLRCLNNKRGELVDLIHTIQTDYKSKFDSFNVEEGDAETNGDVELEANDDNVQADDDDVDVPVVEVKKGKQKKDKQEQEQEEIVVETKSTAKKAASKKALVHVEIEDDNDVVEIKPSKKLAPVKKTEEPVKPVAKKVEAAKPVEEVAKPVEPAKPVAKKTEEAVNVKSVKPVAKKVEEVVKPVEAAKPVAKKTEEAAKPVAKKTEEVVKAETKGKKPKK